MFLLQYTIYSWNRRLLYTDLCTPLAPNLDIKRGSKLYLGGSVHVLFWGKQDCHFNYWYWALGLTHYLRNKKAVLLIFCKLVKLNCWILFQPGLLHLTTPIYSSWWPITTMIKLIILILTASFSKCNEELVFLFLVAYTLNWSPSRKLSFLKELFNIFLFSESFGDSSHFQSKGWLFIFRRWIIWYILCIWTFRFDFRRKILVTFILTITGVSTLK